ncbi:MAG: Bacillosamine/Legionaminic acid biosynthesis aminotransferase PglE [Myxococcaceae bacterium]|nr:Bacillosamine/Legionaminic acid biosynthesis aminotransferase PglE [Myxococcaceae bacterium]
MIPLTVPALGSEEIAASERVLRSGMLVQGREVLAFEAALAAHTGRKHAIAVGSGTAALELALRVLAVGPGAEVLCPALTWPSPAHAVLSLGAEVALCDVHPREWNASAEDFVAARTTRTRAAIVIDQFGNPARHQAIREALDGLPLIVDAACSLGASDGGWACGSQGVIACTSFHPRKVLTTGEGGACLTDDDALAEQLRALRNHGQRAPGVFVCAAGNQRMTELAAAIGSEQLKKLSALVSARRRLGAQIQAAFPGGSFQCASATGEPNQQTLGLLVGPMGEGAATRDRVIAALREGAVQSGPLSYALHTLPQFGQAARAAERAGRSLLVARDIAERGLALPLFPSMSDPQVQTVIEQLGKALDP